MCCCHCCPLRQQHRPGKRSLEPPHPECVPEECHDPDHYDYYEHLLKSIAEEEAALARLVNEEAMKTKRVAERIAGPFTPDEVISFQRSLSDILYNIKKKEELLIKKLRLILDARPDRCSDD